MYFVQRAINNKWFKLKCCKFLAYGKILKLFLESSGSRSAYIFETKIATIWLILTDSINVGVLKQMTWCEGSGEWLTGVITEVFWHSKVGSAHWLWCEMSHSLGWSQRENKFKLLFHVIKIFTIFYNIMYVASMPCD